MGRRRDIVWTYTCDGDAHNGRHDAQLAVALRDEARPRVEVRHGAPFDHGRGREVRDQHVADAYVTQRLGWSVRRRGAAPLVLCAACSLGARP